MQSNSRNVEDIYITNVRLGLTDVIHIYTYLSNITVLTEDLLELLLVDLVGSLQNINQNTLTPKKRIRFNESFTRYRGYGKFVNNYVSTSKSSD